MGTAFILPAIGAAAQFLNARNANSRGQAAATSAINDASGYRTQANNDVANTTAKIANSNPNAIAGSENSAFVNNLRSNMTANSSNNGPTSALGPVSGANSRYGSAVAKATQGVQSYGNANAGTMSAVDAAVRQRQNEALDMQNLSTNLNGLGASAQAKSFVDNLRTQAVSQQNPWVSLFSNLMTGAGNSMAMNGGSSTPSSTAVTFDASNPMNYAKKPVVQPWTGGSMFPQSA